VHCAQTDVRIIKRFSTPSRSIF